jgi:hypothetical protein
VLNVEINVELNENYLRVKNKISFQDDVRALEKKDDEMDISLISYPESDDWIAIDRLLLDPLVTYFADYDNGYEFLFVLHLGQHI